MYCPPQVFLSILKELLGKPFKYNKSLRTLRPMSLKNDYYR